MQAFELAVSKFLETLEDNTDIVWIIICGSYITWNPSKHSDIDLHIILDDRANRRERWNVYIDGFLIEYFMNPIRQHYVYAEEDYQARRIVNAHMLTTWKVILDKTWSIKKLISDMKKHTSKKYSALSDTALELSKYAIRDMVDNLQEIYAAETPDFVFVYHNFLAVLFDKYSAFLQYRKVETHKIYRFLHSESDRKKYTLADFPDEVLNNLFTKALACHETSDMMEAYEQLTHYILEKMWWFAIDWWKLRSECSI